MAVMPLHAAARIQRLARVVVFPHLVVHGCARTPPQWLLLEDAPVRFAQNLHETGFVEWPKAIGKNDQDFPSLRYGSGFLCARSHKFRCQTPPNYNENHRTGKSGFMSKQMERRGPGGRFCHWLARVTSSLGWNPGRPANRVRP